MKPQIIVCDETMMKPKSLYDETSVFVVCMMKRDRTIDDRTLARR